MEINQPLKQHQAICACLAILDLKVLQSNAGYYLGHFCDACGPYDRISIYFTTRMVAEKELTSYLAPKVVKLKALYFQKQQTAKDLADYFLMDGTEREALKRNLKQMNYPKRSYFRRDVELSLWFRATALLYGREQARISATILMNEVDNERDEFMLL